MTRNKGFTLIELMVVVMIVAILAAVLVPMMHGRINRARWSEGIAGAGTVATALRAYCVEQGVDLNVAPSLDTLGLTAGDMDGKYFVQADYVVTAVNYVASTGVITYTITVTCSGGTPTGGPVTLNQDGTFAGIP